MFWEGDDRLIIVRVRGIVWTLREGVSSVQSARLVDELDVILLAFHNISCNTRSNLVGVLVELEVRVVGND